MEYLPYEEPFGTTNDLGFAAPCFQSPQRIGLVLLVPTSAYEDDGVERCIGLGIASAIEAMSVNLAGLAVKGLTPQREANVAFESSRSG